MDKQTPLFIAIVLVLGGVGYLGYQDSKIIPESHAPDQQEFEVHLASLRRIQGIKLDTSIVRNEVFRSLEAPAIPVIQNIAPGNANPFITPQG